MPPPVLGLIFNNGLSKLFVMKIYSIGFTRKGARKFFSLIKNNHIERLIDVRLNNTSQLAGFAKRDDLEYFLGELCQTQYLHLQQLAPPSELLTSYRKKLITWDSYKVNFTQLLADRQVEKTLNKDLLSNSCLLCSEHDHHRCHRTLIIEYLRQHWAEPIEAIHLA